MRLFCELTAVFVWSVYGFRSYSCTIHFLALTVTELPAIGAQTMIPVFYVALDRMALAYPVLYENYTVLPVSITPKDANPCLSSGYWTVTEKIVQLYGSHGLSDSTKKDIHVILAPLCLAAFPAVFDFARELNVLTLACGPGDVTDTRRYSTVLPTFPADSTIMGLTITRLMDLFHWRKLSFFLDKGDRTGRIAEWYNSLMVAFMARAADFDVLTTTFDSLLDKNPYPAALNIAARHSRIILITTLDMYIRKILACAGQLGMISGYYVFIYAYSLQIPFEPPLIWKHGHGPVDQEGLKNMRSVLVLRYAPVDWGDEKVAQMSAAIIKDRRMRYGFKPNPEWVFNEIAFGCYEGVEVLSQVMNDSLGEGQTLEWNAKDTAQKAAGRTFALSTRNVTFNSERKRIPEFILQQFNETLENFEDLMSFDHVSKSWVFLSSRRFNWSEGKEPRDFHECGFQHDLCSTSSRNFSITVISAAVVCVVLTTGLTYWYQRKIRMQQSVTYWKIRADDLTGYLVATMTTHGSQPKTASCGQISSQSVQSGYPFPS